MLKGVSKVLFVMLLAMTSCSGHDDAIEGGGLNKPETEQQTVTMTISRASASEFVGAGITQLSVYTYKVDRKVTTLFDEQTVDVSSSEFNGAVLAGHPSRYGVEFVTWEWSCGRTGLWQGHYYDPGSGPNGYLSAKQDFCVRSGLMDQHRLFTNEQLAEVYRCVSETLESAYPITPERQKLLEGVSEQIRWAVPDLPELVSQSNERELEAMSQEEQLDVTMEM